MGIVYMVYLLIYFFKEKGTAKGGVMINGNLIIRTILWGLNGDLSLIMILLTQMTLNGCC